MQGQTNDKDNASKTATNGGAYIGGDVSTNGGDVVLRDKIQYFLNLPALPKDVGPWLRQNRWPFAILIGFELLFYFPYQQYSARFLLSLWIYIAAAILLAVAVWYWCKVIRDYSCQFKIKNTLAVAGITTILYGGLMTQQVSAILFPAQIPPEKFGIAVATFGEGPDFRITRRGLQISGLITSELQQSISKTHEISNTVTLVKMGVVRGVEQGRLDGDRIGADLVIWGQILEQEEGVVVNFQVLQTPGMIDNPAFPQVLPVTQRYVQSSIDIQHGDSITVKQITEQQSVAITAFSLGLYYQSLPDYKLAAEQFQLAVNYLEKASESTSIADVGLVLLYLGRSYVQLGRYDQALEIFNRAADYRPDDSALYVGLAYLYRVMGQEEQQQQALNRVIELGREYQTTNNWLPALYNSGIAYEAKEEYQAALREYQAILAKDPTFFSAYLSAGRVLMRLERLDEALQMHQQAQSLVKDHPTRAIWLSLDAGRLYELLGDPDAAIAAYMHANALNPELATPYFFLAQLYEKQGANDAAFINYRKLLSVSYDPAWAHALFAAFLYQIGDHQAAIEQYLQALRHPIYHPALTYAYLGRAYAAAGEQELALKAFDEALSKPDPNATYVHSLYANVLVQFDLIDEAIFHYEESLKIDGGVAFETKLNLAQQYERLNELDKARALYESLLKAEDQLSDEQQQMVQERLRAIAEK